MAAPVRGRVGGRDGGELVTGAARETHGRQPAVRRRVLRRSCQPGHGEYPAGASHPPAERVAVTSPARPATRASVGAPLGARRASRAFKDVMKVLTVPADSPADRLDTGGLDTAGHRRVIDQSET